MLSVRTEDNKVFKQISTPAFEDRVIADGGTVSSVDSTDKILDAVAAIGVQPSVVMVPSGIKASKLYSQIPYGGGADFSVTRSGTTGMRLNNGYWQPVAADTPRVDLTWNDATQMFEEWLEVEEARTNLISRYKSFAHSDWTKSGASIQGDPNTAGAEKVTNGGFDTDTAWTKGAGISIADGTCIFNVLSGNISLSQTIFETSQISKLFRLTITCTAYTAGTLYLRATGFNSRLINLIGPGAIISGTGTITTYIVAESTSQIIEFVTDNGTGFSGSIDNISVKEVTGYASPFVDSAGNNLMSGYKLVDDTSNGLHYIAVYQTGVIGETFSYTFYAKAAERSKIQLLFQGAGLSSVVFDLSEVTATKNSLVSKAEINYFVDGWYKCTVTGTLTVTSRRFSLYTYKTSDTYLGDGTSGILIAHAQLEAGATASSPIGGAEGSQQSRNADVISSAVDYSGVKTLVINNDAYVVGTSLPNNGYWLEQIRHSRLIMFNRVLSDAEITAAGWTKRQLAFAPSINVTAGTSVSIEVNGSGYIDWGDGTTDSYSSQVTKTHFYTGGYRGLIKFVGTLTRFKTSSSANWYFNLSSLPAVMSYFYCAGSNTVTGNLSSLPANLTYFYCAGSNTVTGNLSSLPANLGAFYCIGSNTITGNLSSLPSVMTTFYCTGSNTITGNLSSLPSNLTYFNCTGSNTVTGNLSSLPANLTIFECAGSNTIADYTAGRTWSNNINYVFIRQAAGYGFDSTEVDNLLIDLALATWAGSSRTVDVRGVNAARTSASDAAVATLISKSVTVLTN